MNILDKIIKKKRGDLHSIIEAARNAEGRSRKHHSLKSAVINSRSMSVIAEVKRGSPSLGHFAPDIDVLDHALMYQANGAAAVSILTDSHFYGSSKDLMTIAPHLSIPILAKDFIIHKAQIDLHYSHGADLILLIAAVLSPEEISSLSSYAQGLGMEVLLELHSLDDIPLSLIPPGVLLGINNRNLKTFDVTLSTSMTHAEALKPLGYPLIAESGIRQLSDAHRLSSAGFSGMLIGESLIKDASASQLLAAFSTVEKSQEVLP